MSVEEKYETLEKIGHGSFGIIRKVRRKTDGFIMCRKEISYLRMSQKEREQLHAEFQILSHLRHPNIVAYYHREHLKLSQDLHLYMEYCGNGDLGRVIKELQLKGHRAQETFVWSIFSQLVLALFRCHYGVDPPEVGSNILGLPGASHPKAPAGTVTILHRDLKPENVFLGEDNSVKLGDFGLSKMIKSHDFASTYVGTPFYMSPEICAAEKYTLKSDIWSLGCIIYELCAREPPFNAKTHFQLVQKIKEGKVAPLPDMYSPELNQVIRDCLKVNPDRRPDTAQLLNLPIVRLMRKEKEIVELGRALRTREEATRKKEQDLGERLISLDREKQAMRAEVDSSLRREWEVKARLEIDRLVKAEVERLQKKFEEEVQARVRVELESSRKKAAPPETLLEDHGLSVAHSEYHHSTMDNTSGDEFPSITDATEYSVDSPDMSRETKKTTTTTTTTIMTMAARTPFGRAQTMFVSTPMDVEMASPSPVALATLSLSPRRTGNTKAPAVNANIFAAAAAAAASAETRWDHRDPTLLESDDEEAVPSPTRLIKSTTKNSILKPSTASKIRPLLSAQKPGPATNRLKHQSSNTGLLSKAIAASQPELRARSPAGRLTKISSATSLHQHDTISGISRKPSAKQDAAATSTTSSASSSSSSSSSSSAASSSAETAALGKPILLSKNTTNIKGRTLVELQQARAGGRPLSVNSTQSCPENITPKRAAAAAAAARSASGSNEPVAVWDPERDDMPSPFLAKYRRIAKV